MLTTRRHQPDSLILFFGSLILFTWGLSSQEIEGFDSRFYLFAQEMRLYGISWFPMTYHQLYPDYPSASTLMINLFATFFGGLNKLTAVLPTAILAALTVTLTYLIGSLHHRHWGWCAAMFTLLTSAFVKSARGISLDMYPAVITAACFYLIYSADQKNKPQRARWIYPLLFLGFAFRGPIGLVMPAGIICSYYFLHQNFKKLFFNGFIAFILLCVCTALLLALAYHAGGDTFMHDVLRMEILGRMDNHFLPRYFYFTNSFGSYAITYPLAWLVLGGAIFYAYTSRDFSPDKTLLLHLFGWVMVILVGMSIPDDKKVRYILPILPAIALIAAYPFIAPSSQRYFASMRIIFRRVLLVFPLFLIAITLYIYLNKHTHTFGIHSIQLLAFFAIMQSINFIMIYIGKSVDEQEKIIVGIAALSFVIANIMIIEPIQLYIDRARDLVVSIETQRIHDNARLAFYNERPDGLPIKYLINRMNNDQPVFIQNEKELMDFSEPAYFITSESYYDELPLNVAKQLHVIAKDTLGHVEVVVFTNKKGN